MLQVGILTVIKPAGAFRGLNVITHEDEGFVFTGAVGNIIVASCIGDGVLPLGKLHNNLVLACIDMIKSGGDDLRMGKAGCDLLITETNACQQCDHAAEIVQVNNVVIDQVEGFLNTVMTHSEGAVVAVDVSQQEIRDRGCKIATGTSHSSDMTVTDILRDQCRAAHRAVYNIPGVGWLDAVGLFGIHTEVYTIFVVGSKGSTDHRH